MTRDGKGPRLSGGGLALLLLWGTLISLAFSLVLQGLLAFSKLEGLSERKVIGSLDWNQLLDSGFVEQALWFIGAFALVHLVAAALLLGAWVWLALHWIQQQRSGYLLLVVTGCGLLFLANRCFYPQSYFSGQLEAPNYLWWALWGGVALWLGCALGGGLNRKPVWMAAVGSCLVAWGGSWLELDSGSSSVRDKPDVVIIGFDSLRPDVVGDAYTPHLMPYLRQAMVFPNAVTPLARTYPSWMTILTGLNPVNHGARFNLIADSYLAPDLKTLPEYLSESGYQSLFAMDERRFANISKRHGFDWIEGPDLGVAEFLISEVSDTPVLNFIRHFSISKWLFPQLFSNRAAFVSYGGEEYVEAVGHKLRGFDPARPALSIVHFCKSHWPYSFVSRNDKAETRFQRFEKAPIDDDFFQEYLKAVTEADQQFGLLMEQLKASGRLDNAIVFFLSDHGESFPHDSLNLDSIDAGGERYRLSAYGHGTHATLPAQFQVLIAYQFYKDGKAVPKADVETEGRVSVADVTPTVLEYVGLSTGRGFDGRSLLQGSGIEGRDFFVESDFSVPAMLHSKPSAKDALGEGVGFYQVLPSGEVQLRSDKVQSLIELKEYSLLTAGGMIAYGAYRVGEGYDAEAREGFRYLDTQSNTWRVLTESGPLELVTGARKLCQQFFGDGRLSRESICQVPSLVQLAH